MKKGGASCLWTNQLSTGPQQVLCRSLVVQGPWFENHYSSSGIVLFLVLYILVHYAEVKVYIQVEQIQINKPQPPAKVRELLTLTV